MKLFCECIKDATSQSVHVRTALGNERRRRQNNRMASELSEMTEAKYPDVSVAYDQDDDVNSDILRGDFKMPFEVKKVEPDQQLIFGWASVVEKNGNLIVDKQGDMIPVEELENAAYDFVLFSRDHGDMHRNVGVGKMVESMVFTREKQQALGIDLGLVGWWVGFKVHDRDVWDAHKRGDRLEFSIGGAAVPVEVTQKRGGRRHSRFPFDQGAADAAHLTLTRFLAHQRTKLLNAYEAHDVFKINDPIVRVLDEADDVFRYTTRSLEGHLLRAAQRTGAHAVDSLIGNPGRMRYPSGPRHQELYATVANNVDEWARQYAVDRVAEMVDRVPGSGDDVVAKASRGSIQKTTRDIADELVKEALKNGWSTRRLERELVKTGVFDPGRAEMIARTEISAVQNAAMLQAGYEYEEENDETLIKIWLLGPRPCPICEENGDQELELDEEFESGHMAPPVHPNCMCELQLVSQ